MVRLCSHKQQLSHRLVLVLKLGFGVTRGRLCVVHGCLLTWEKSSFLLSFWWLDSSIRPPALRRRACAFYGAHRDPHASPSVESLGAGISNVVVERGRGS